MHTVTSSDSSISGVLVKACEAGEYVERDGRYFRVSHLHAATKDALALDGKSNLGPLMSVNRVPLGTVITIVVGGENSKPNILEEACDRERERQILERHAELGKRVDECCAGLESLRTKPQTAEAPDNGARYTRCTFMGKRIYLMDDDPGSSRNQQFKKFWDLALVSFPEGSTDAEFLDSLRGREIKYSLGIERTPYDAIARGGLNVSIEYEGLHGGRNFNHVETFAEAVQWLREKVDD